MLLRFTALRVTLKKKISCMILNVGKLNRKIITMVVLSLYFTYRVQRTSAHASSIRQRNTRT